MEMGDVCYCSSTQSALTDVVREGDEGGDSTEQGWGRGRTGTSRSCPSSFHPPEELGPTDRAEHSQLSLSSFQKFHLISLEGTWGALSLSLYFIPRIPHPLCGACVYPELYQLR